MINYTPLEYLKIDVATQRGLSQEQFEDRIAWFDRVNDNPDVDFESYVEFADKPYQYMAAVLAYQDAIAGIASGHMVGLDASASGIAIMGIVTGCKVTCKNTGVIGDKKMDMYSECTKEMNSILGTKKTYDRKTVKYVQMPYFYGSEKTAKTVFGEGSDEYIAFYKAQDEVAPGAVWLRNELIMSWQAFALNHRSVMPDGFVAINPVLKKVKTKLEIDELNHAQLQYIYEVNVGEKRGLSTAANPVHQIDGFLVRELNRRCNYSQSKLRNIRGILKNSLQFDMSPDYCMEPMERSWLNHSYLSLVGIEHINPDNVIDYGKQYKLALLDLINQTLEYKAFECVFIHDEYKCHPNHMNRLREIFIGMLAELAEGDVMGQIIRDIRNDPNYEITKISNDIGELIREGEYSIA